MNTHAIGSRTKDCSQGFCSLHCPQWCYIIFPPPPPPFEDFPDDQSSALNFSPLVITIIGFLAGALLLVSYYAILSKYCRNRFSSTRHDQNNHDVDVEMGEINDPDVHEPWFVATNGLDEALIRSITMFKYKRREGLVEGADCSVCLSEFVEDERLKLLPKCSHAFHVECIETWLKCHSNCPLCRANVAGPISSPPCLPLHSPAGEPLSLRHGEVESSGAAENMELDIRDQDVEQVNVNAPKTPTREWKEFRCCSETSNETGDDEGNRRIRRSVSMDCICEPRLSIDDVINRRSGEDDCEMRPSEMKRSHSSGRWFVSKWGKSRNSVIPLSNFTWNI